MRFTGHHGMDVLKEVAAAKFSVPVIVMMAFGTVP
jgi:FixJ family two-component response regulator